MFFKRLIINVQSIYAVKKYLNTYRVNTTHCTALPNKIVRLYELKCNIFVTDCPASLLVFLTSGPVLYHESGRLGYIVKWGSKNGNLLC